MNARVACLALLLGAPAVATAQETSPPPTATGPAPVALAEISTRAAEVASRLKSLEATAMPRPEIAAIEQRMTDLAARIPDRTAALHRALRGNPDRETLEDLQAEWGALRAELAQAERDIGPRAAEIDRELAGLSALAAVWSLTEKAAREAGAPAAVVDRVRETLSAIGKLRKLLERRRKAVLELQDRIVEARARTDDALAAIRQAQAQLVERILVRDALPLWRSLPRAAGPAGIAAAAAASIRQKVSEALGYVREHRTPLAVQALLVAVAALLLARGRRAARQWAADDPDLARAEQIFEVPLSSAIVLATMTSGWLQPHAPRALTDLLGLLALVPGLRLLRGCLPRNVVVALYALGAFYLADRLRSLVSAAEAIEQLLFTLEMLVAAAAAVALSRRASRGAAAPRQRLLTRGTAALAGIFGAAAFAEAAGFRNLARLVGAGTLDSLYAAVVVYAAFLALQGLVIYALRSPLATHSRAVRMHGPLLRRRARRLLQWAAVGAWTWRALGEVGLLSPVLEAATALLGARLERGSLSVSLGDVLLLVASVWGAVLISRLIRFVLNEDVFPRVRLAHGVPYAVSTLLHYSLVTMGFLFGIAAVGLDMSRFAIVAGALGIGVGFGLQNIVSNFVSGLILLFERPIQVGDVIQLGDLAGEVRAIGIRACTVRTWEGAEVIVPNADLISQQVTNWTLSDRMRRVQIPVGVAYGTDPRRVLELLTRTVTDHPEVLREPAPLALFTGFGESSLDFEVRAWTGRFENWWAVRSDLITRIYRVLGEAGIEIPFPQRDLHLRSVAPGLGVSGVGGAAAGDSPGGSGSGEAESGSTGAPAPGHRE